MNGTNPRRAREQQMFTHNRKDPFVERFNTLPVDWRHVQACSSFSHPIYLTQIAPTVYDLAQQMLCIKISLFPNVIR